MLLNTSGLQINPPSVGLTVNNNSNTTNVMHAVSVSTSILSIAGYDTVLEGPALHGLFDPINDYDAVTKNYVDTYPVMTGVAGPNGAIQLKSSSGFAGLSTLTFNGTSMVLTGTMSMITASSSIGLTISNSYVSNVTNPIEPQDAATKNYVNIQNISVENLATSVFSNQLTASNVFNKILQRTTTALSSVQDIMPSSSDIITEVTLVLGSADVGTTFTFVYKYLSVAPENIVLYFNDNLISPQGNILLINGQVNAITLQSNSLCYMTGVVLSGTSVGFYINSIQSLYFDTAQITPSGLITSIFESSKMYSTLNNSYIIYPVVPTSITATGTYTYTWSDVKNMLLVRSGQTSNVTDTFSIASTFLNSTSFAMNSSGGSGFKFVIQNISTLYSVTLSAPTGWTFITTPTIAPGKNGLFYVNCNSGAVTCTLYTIGLYGR